jgi:hypothetical protein
LCYCQICILLRFSSDVGMHRMAVSYEIHEVKLVLSVITACHHLFSFLTGNKKFFKLDRKKGILETTILSRSMCDYRRGLDWRMDLLTTYTNDLELQTITAPPLISTTHKSSQHPLSLFPTCRVFTSRSLVTASSSEDSSASRAQVLSSLRTELN